MSQNVPVSNAKCRTEDQASCRSRINILDQVAAAVRSTPAEV